ncbi:GDSL esterase/lipase [Gossypium australe]|uniref:GDSL esterase/lipase n=1 Tax=Gossypium australe TaxID=47621 RepID=A0A5B6W4K8_9ROSI|nr:GDSL esterase/lipase [Gossypium australe]
MGVVKEGRYPLVPFFTLYMILFLYLPLLPHSVHCQCTKTPIIFNFGDSNSDTGGYADGVGLNFSPPNGRTYFHQPARRLSDGRLMIDFLCESLNTDYLTPYLNSLGPNFTNGVNFAIIGSATLPRYVPFSLFVQVSQFLRFRSRSPALMLNGYKDLVGDEDFENALYTIDIGQNDLAASFDNLTYSQVIERIPSFITEIKNAIWNMYEKGGKKFWVHNTGPLGCLPQKLALLARNATELDEHGCLQPFNNAAKTFNAQLRVLCEQLRRELINVTIVYVDIYSIKYDLIANASNYGFESPLMACCGNGGPPYNYNANINCGRTGYTVCHEGSKFISWDGVHYTEAANAIFASKILSTHYSTPQLSFNFFCNNM